MFKKRSEALAAQKDSSSSHPPKSNQLSLTRREAEVTVNERPKEATPRDTPSSQAMNAPVQPPAPSETANSLLLCPVYTESQSQESRINAGERPTRIRGENGDTTPSEPASATLSHEMDGEDPSRNNRRFADEHRRANSARRMSDHYSPPSVTSRPLVISPTQSHRLIDSWRPQNSSNGPRAEPMRATSPTTGRKRPSEYTDNEYGHRARRQRGDVWVAQDHDRDRSDSYRLHRDRRLDSESDERRAAYRAPSSPIDRSRPYPLDMSRAIYDNRTYTSEEPTSPVARWEQPYRRTEGDDTYHRYQPSAPVYNAMADQHYTDDARLGQAYEPMTEESMATQPELLARIHDTQRFPVIVRHY
ncbi:hypothetical protein EV363DRAFT_896056 [Boletus edulis]|nr:hypothetical protein EV363DRAFT_896056 [Boletus edulis]